MQKLDLIKDEFVEFLRSGFIDFGSANQTMEFIDNNEYCGIDVNIKGYVENVKSVTLHLEPDFTTGNYFEELDTENQSKIKKALSEYYYMPENSIYQDDECYPDEFIFRSSEEDEEYTAFEVVTAEVALQNELDTLSLSNSEDFEWCKLAHKNYHDRANEIGYYTKLKDSELYHRIM